MKKLLFTLLFLTLGSAWGGALEDGKAAYGRKDYATSLKLLRPLAEKGNAYAQYNIGYMYANGQGVAQDYKEAVKWSKLAAEQGFAFAQSNLGVRYANGQGVLQDYKEALKWYRRAAEQGHATAQYNIGLMYAKGQGVLQDYKEAVKWYRLAAEQGEASAQTNLGVMYYEGKGVLQDYARAHMWLNVASAAGISDAIKNRDIVANKMTPQQIEKAQEMAKACQASNFKGCLDEANKQWEADMGNEVAAYKAKIRAKILRNYIVMSSDIPKDALAEFDVTLSPGGVVLNVKLVKSSGSAMYDRAVERAIKKSDPLPVPPEGLLSNQFRELRLNFSPED